MKPKSFLKILRVEFLTLLLLIFAQSTQAIIPFGFMRKKDCTVGSPSPGTVCLGGTIFLGTLTPGATSGSGTNRYMTTPGGCGEIPAAQKVSGIRTPAGDYPNADFTPSCSGSDSLTKTWNDGSFNSEDGKSIAVDIPSLINYTTTAGTGQGAVNTDQYYGDFNTANIVLITTASQGGYHAAARYCEKLSFGGFTDWYLPNRYELNLMYTNAASIPGLDTTGTWYWSSTEGHFSSVWVQRLSDGNQVLSNKYNQFSKVRCVRRY